MKSNSLDYTPRQNNNADELYNDDLYTFDPLYKQRLYESKLPRGTVLETPHFPNNIPNYTKSSFPLMNYDINGINSNDYMRSEFKKIPKLEIAFLMILMV